MPGKTMTKTVCVDVDVDVELDAGDIEELMGPDRGGEDGIWIDRQDLALIMLHVRRRDSQALLDTIQSVLDCGKLNCRLDQLLAPKVAA